MRGSAFSRLGGVGAAALCTALVTPAPAQVPGGQLVADAKAKVLAACQTTNVKIVFQVTPYLYYVDFNETVPQIHQFKNESQAGGAFLPVISNDGSWVTYAKGVSGDGQVYNPAAGSAWAMELDSNATPLQVAAQGYVPRFVQNPAAGTVEVVYSTDATCPRVAYGRDTLTTCNAAGQTLKKAITKSTRALGSAQTVFANGSYFGGLSYDNNYLCTGWTGSAFDPLMVDLRSPSTPPKHMHTVAVKKIATGADSSVTLNCCNPSRSASRAFPDAMMFFDFSSQRFEDLGFRHPILVNGWGLHQVLFISRYGTGTYGTTTRNYWMPQDIVIDESGTVFGAVTDKQWQNPEWSTHPYFAVASMTVNRAYRRATGGYKNTTKNQYIYIIDLRTGQSTRVVEVSPAGGTGSIPDSSNSFTVSNPFLYVDVPSGFSEDQTWLSTPALALEVPVRNPINRLGRMPGLSMKDGFVQGAGVKRISLHDALGRTVASVVPGARRVNLADVFGNVRSGVYFLRIETANAAPSVFRWVVR